MKIYTINEAGLEHIRLQLIEKLKNGNTKEWFEEEHLKDSTDTKNMLSAWASDLEDDLDLNQRDWGEVELSQHHSKSGRTEFISVETGHFDILHREWQVTYDTEHKPAFGLDMFEDEDEALSAANEYRLDGQQNVVVTLFENDSPIEDIDDE